MQKLGDIFDEWMDANQEGRSHFIGPSGLKDCYRALVGDAAHTEGQCQPVRDPLAAAFRRAL